MSKKAGLAALASQIRICQNCPLWKTRIKAVPGEGDPGAKIVLVGEAPGKNEDLKGKPFCGAAGRILEQLLSQAGLNRKEVFITSVLKCRPPQNRDPKLAEIKSCKSYLEKQIQIIKPKLIIALGRWAAYALVGIKKETGQILTLNLGPDFTTSIFITYHPAYAIYSKNAKNALINDFKKIPQLVKPI